MKALIKQWKSAIHATAFAAVFAIALAGCSGGGGDGSPTPAPQQSSWDTMVWDQADWQ